MISFGREKPTTLAGERIYAIGDIHGRLDLFQRLLKCLEEDSNKRGPSRTSLIVLGDIIDRGPYSRQMVEVMFNVRANVGGVTLLCGNHEELLLHSCSGNGVAQAVWVENGGSATLESYGLDPTKFLELSAQDRGALLRKVIGKDILTWMSQLPIAHRSGDYFFCHAGVRPGIGLNEQKREDLLWIRNPFLADRRLHGAVIVHGHSEVPNVEIRRNRINVDTAAYRSGLLSAVGLEGRSKWIVST